PVPITSAEICMIHNKISCLYFIVIFFITSSKIKYHIDIVMSIVTFYISFLTTHKIHAFPPVLPDFIFCKTGSHFRNSLTVEELAEQKNMSVSLFHQKFKSAVGMGPLQCQKRLRLTEARRLISPLCSGRKLL